jgi:hypothetical protein
MPTIDLRAVADKYVASEWGPKWRVAHSCDMENPNGLFCSVGRRDGQRYLDGPVPFFVREAGEIVQFTNPIVVTVLERHLERSGDENLLSAYFEPDPQYADVLRPFVRDCLSEMGQTGQKPDADA